MSAGVCSGTGYAISSSAGTQAGSFMKLGIGSPKAQALGHAYLAMAEGPDALVWNPAGVGMTKQRELYVSYLKWVQDYSGYYFGYVHPIGQTVVGVNAAYMTMDGFDARDANNIPLPSGDVAVRNDFLSVTLARSFFVESLALGASVKRVSENNDGTEYATMVFDVGAQVHFGTLLHVGGSMMNMGNKDEVVQISRIGAALCLGPYFTLSGELENPSDNRVRPGLGLEINVPEEATELGKLSFRVGYYDADDHGKNYDNSLLERFNLTKTSKLSFGVGVYTSQMLGYGVGIDYAFTPFGALGTVNQLGLRFVF